MSNKEVLKAAKTAIDSKNWDDAISNAQQVLANDPKNYFAHLFLGLAFQQKGQLSESEKSYNAAAQIRPDDAQAWLGLRDLFEKQGSKRVSEHTKVGLKLAEIYGMTDDKHRGQAAINKVVEFAKKNGTNGQYLEALQTQLPTSTVYHYLEGRLPHPYQSYLRLAEITEKVEAQRIEQAVNERRTRLGARVAQVTVEVKREVYAGSNLEDIYKAVIDWTPDDDERRVYEEKLFQRAYDTLAVSQAAVKDAKRQQVMKLAEGMVIIKHPFRLAWEIELEWKDAKDLEDLDADVVHQFVHLFPEHGLSKVLRGFISSDISPWPASPPAEQADGEESEDIGLTAEDRLVLMTEGIELAKDSYLAHRLMSDYYMHIGEYEVTVELARKALKLLASATAVSGLKFQAYNDAVSSTLATSLIYYQTPRNHPEAKDIFVEILQRNKTFTPGLIGIGLILEEEEEFAEAIEFLNRALARDPTNFRIGAEAAWCKAMAGDFAGGLDELQRYLQGMNSNDARGRELKAQTLYRIGKCRWEVESSKAARKDRKHGPYVDFLSAIKTDPTCAPAYTALGMFYEYYANDKKRARQCYQKAFELASAEIIAAERMARSYADSGDWEIVEVIAQRVVDTGRVKPAPGSRRKGISWPFSALGVVQMNRLNYSEAIVSFLAALRISPDDYHSYVGLGEAYHNSGRYNSALRAFNYANSPPDGVTLKESGETWFTRYMLANVHRDIGDFEEAINMYREVLISRPNEFGVSIALLQTLVEQAIRSVETGFFGLAVTSATDAIEVAKNIAKYQPDAFNLWKAVGDACIVFSWIQRRASQFPTESIASLIRMDETPEKFDVFVSVDKIDVKAFDTLQESRGDGEGQIDHHLRLSLVAALLAYKRAISSCSHDIHAQAVSWYNLGWAEFRAHACLEQAADGDATKIQRSKFLHASMRCFKRAIELEAGNSDFWAALGVVTTQRSPKVAQHAFVRSLHLNERNPKTWTNLGTLYLLENDVELAQQAFIRAQSTDPDYAPAWVGVGILALLTGKAKEAKLHFTHAFEISGADYFIAKRLYGTSVFDKLTRSTSRADVEDLIRPLFAMAQLHAQETTSNGIPYNQLLALLHERAGNYEDATVQLTSLADLAERDFEKTESKAAMFQYASVKADLARNKLAALDFESAADAAEMALGLTADEADGAAPDARRKVRLSAHLTSGLAGYYQKDMDTALQAFRAALTESNSNPDVICLLCQVLWAQGGLNERSVAREQLFEAVEKNTGHVPAVCLLGVMGVMDGDADVCEAVKEELQLLRMADNMSEKQRADVENVLEAVISSLGPDSEESTAQELNEVQTSIMLYPNYPHPWTQLAELALEEAIPSQMALNMALRSVPPRGSIEEGELAVVLAGAGSIADAQRAVFVAPWKATGWRALDKEVPSME